MPSRFHALTVATVVKVRDPNVTYPYCIECYSKLRSNCHSRNWHCFRCQVGYNICNVPQRYRLCLEIADGSALCGATVFGKSLEPYFGGSADEIHSLFRLYDLNYIMNLLNDFFTGKSFLFGFKTLHPLQKSDFNISLLSILKSSCRKHCDTLPTDLIASQMISCGIGMEYTIKIHLTEGNSFKTQNTPSTIIEPSLQKPIESVPPESFIGQTNSNSTFPLISQELIVLSYEMNPSGSQTNRNLSDMLISSSRVSKTPNFINSCTTNDLSFHITKSHSTQTYKSFVINSFPDLIEGDISNHFLPSDKKVQSGSHSSVKHSPQVFLADNPNEEITSYISDCEDIHMFLDENNSSNLVHKYSPGLPISQKEYSMECSLNVNNDHFSYAPESEDLEAFLNSFSNSPHSGHEHFSEFHEKTEQNQLHKTKSAEKEMCFLKGYDFKTSLKLASCNKPNLKTLTLVTANNIRTEDTREHTTQMLYWKTRELNVLSLLSFHSSTVTYFLLNLSVPYRLLKCVWKDNQKYKNRDKLNRNNQSIGDMTCHSELILHNHKLNSFNEAHQFCNTRNKMIPRKPIIEKDLKHSVKSADLCLSSGPVKILTKTHLNNENISNVCNKYPTKMCSSNEYLPKLQSTKRYMSTLNSTNEHLFKLNFIGETPPKLSPSNTICNIFPGDTPKMTNVPNIYCDACINLSTMSPCQFHINRMFFENDSINGNISVSEITASVKSDSPFRNKVNKPFSLFHSNSLSTSSEHLSSFQEIIHSTRYLSKRFPNQDSNLERGPSVLNQSKKRKKCNLYRSCLQTCRCNDFSEKKENVSYNGKREVLCFSTKLSNKNNKNISQSKQFVNKTIRLSNKTQHSVPSKKSDISSTIMKNQFSNLPGSSRVANEVNSTGQTCLSLPHKNINNSLARFHTFSTNVNLRKCHNLTSTPVSHSYSYQPSYLNLLHKDSSARENIERLFPITPIKSTSKNQKQSCSDSPLIFSSEGYNSESPLLPAVSLQHIFQECPKEQDNISHDLYDPSAELFLPSSNLADVILPVNTSEDLFNYSLKSSNHFIPQTSSGTPVSVRNISMNTTDGINETLNHQNSKKSKYFLSKCLLKRQIFKKINNSNLFQTKCQMKTLSSSNTIPKTASRSSSLMKQHNRNGQTFIDSSEELTETSTSFMPLFSPRILSGNEFHSPRATNYINSKEISKCNSLIISKAAENIFQNVGKSHEPEQFCKTIPDSQVLFSPEIPPATQDKTKHLLTFQNKNINSLDNPLHSCFKLKTDVNQQQIHFPKLFKEIQQETHNVSNQNSTKVNFKIQNNAYLYKRTPKSCNKTLDIYASPDIFCSQPKNPNVHSCPSEDFSRTYQNTHTLSQSLDIFPPTLENTSVHNETPDILPETQTNVDNSIQSPDILNETEQNSCIQLLSPDMFSPTQKNKQDYLHSTDPIYHTPENITHYLLSPDIFSQTQKNTEDHLKSPEIFSQTPEPSFTHKKKYFYSLNQISSSTKNIPLQHKDTLCKVLFCSDLVAGADDNI